MKQCDICYKDIKESQYETDGEHDFHDKCWQQYQIEAAISAGIPRSVVEGKTKLRDHFSKEYINYKCNKKD